MAADSFNFSIRFHRASTARRWAGRFSTSREAGRVSKACDSIAKEVAGRDKKDRPGPSGCSPFTQQVDAGRFRQIPIQDRELGHARRDGAIRLRWLRVGDDGGAPITEYEVSCDTCPNPPSPPSPVEYIPAAGAMYTGLTPGLDYVFDWVVDDLPTWLTTKYGPLMSMPYNLEINDSIVYAVEKHATGEMYRRFSNTVSTFEKEFTQNPRVLAIGLHPHLIAVPHRFGELERMVDDILGRDDAVFMTGSQICDWFAAADA